MATSTHTRTLGPLEALSRDVEAVCAAGAQRTPRPTGRNAIGNLSAQMKKLSNQMYKLAGQRLPYRSGTLR